MNSIATGLDEVLLQLRPVRERRLRPVRERRLGEFEKCAGGRDVSSTFEPAEELHAYRGPRPLRRRVRALPSKTPPGSGTRPEPGTCTCFVFAFDVQYPRASAAC
jgi:hypothetical protein